MTSRLPPQPGEWIDREQPLDFQFEGVSYQGYTGDVLSSALWANGVHVLGRSFKYHRPRGIYSLANHDANALVSVGSRTNLRADCLPLEAGLQASAVNTLGSASRDYLAIMDRFSRFLPVGFYYKAFHTPRRLFPFYEKQMRKVAGLGKIDPQYREGPTGKQYDFCDLLIVGAGPAGLSAAVDAGERGLRVILVDENPHPGGSFTWQWQRNAEAQERYKKLLDRLHVLENIDLRPGTIAGGVYSDYWVALFDQHRLTKLRASAVLIASGCFEQPAVFQNNDAPGIMLGSAAQRLIHRYAVQPFTRGVILGANSDAYRLASDLAANGIDVTALCDLRPEGEPSTAHAQVEATGIPVYRGFTIYQAETRRRGKQLAGVIACPLDRKGEPQPQAGLTLPCDGVAVSVGWAPDGGLLYQAGARFQYKTEVEQFVPNSLPAGLFAAGRVNGIFSWPDQCRDGLRAAREASVYLGQPAVTELDSVTHQGPSPSHPYPIFSHPGKHNFVDFDEDIHLADFKNAHQEGYDNIELVKRFTTVGMGPSQGKLSNMNAIRILARHNRATIQATGTTTSRPFQHPVPLGHLAGRRFHPLRRTPLDAWHRQAGGQMAHAGSWLRPEYYGPADQRDQSILSEANQVRQTVGLIDVSTLGKLQITGPDAAEFLERIYTGRFHKQPTERLRYGLACDETGTVLEDGVIARLADDHFYVTATSGGSGAFYRELLRWRQIFQLNVQISNLTGQLAAINLAGPESRNVLKDLTSIDIAGDAFPYLGVRRGTVAGVAATLMRVGFVGELGYEIHVPASSALHVWEVLADAGRPFGLKPFGVETQRLLRLEKGHLIVGHDTDALTHPAEADLNWAIAKNKPFFVGSRSLEILQQRPLTRQLVGFRLADADVTPFPKECHLIFDGDTIVGRVTSIARYSTLKHPLGMAFVQPRLASPGSQLHIRTAPGKSVVGEVCSLPFYDPENLRQQ